MTIWWTGFKDSEANTKGKSKARYQKKKQLKQKQVLKTKAAQSKPICSSQISSALNISFQAIISSTQIIRILVRRKATVLILAFLDFLILKKTFQKLGVGCKRSALGAKTVHEIDPWEGGCM